MERSEPGQNVSWHIVAVIAGCALAGFAVFAVVVAPAQRAAFEKARADEIAAEDRDTCRQFRMPEGSTDFTTCRALLNDFRKRQTDRFVLDAGIL